MDLEEDVNLDGGGEEMDESRGELDRDDRDMDGDDEHDTNDDGELIGEETDEEEHQFDISISATHSYMGSSLVGVPGRSVLEAGTRARLPALAHHGAVFPGETVPMMLAEEQDAAIIVDTLHKDKLFGLLCPDETCTVLSGYGVVCEVFEAEVAYAASPPSVLVKARAVHRFRLKDMPKRALPVELYASLRAMEVVVLPELSPAPALRPARLAALDACRRPLAPPAPENVAVRRLDAALTPWPRFVFEIFDLARMRSLLHRHFRTLGLEKMLPAEAVSLSFWVASNLALAARDRLALLAVDNALLRLHMECHFIARSVLCCTTCETEIARQEHATSMSSDGLHGNYTNQAGFVHDVLTVSAATNTRPAGPPSTEYSWFPGYAWTTCLCACCSQHVGWRFDAAQRMLRPRRFYALCRNYVVPRDALQRLPPDTPPL